MKMNRVSTASFLFSLGILILSFVPENLSENENMFIGIVVGVSLYSLLDEVKYRLGLVRIRK